MDLAALSYIPWGNARYNATSGAVACQHGQRECELNTVLSCGIHQGEGQAGWFPFVSCLEEEVAHEKDTAAVVAKCAADANLSEADITACAQGACQCAGWWGWQGRQAPGCCQSVGMGFKWAG
jgi:hypothetical protein